MPQAPVTLTLALAADAPEPRVGAPVRVVATVVSLQSYRDCSVKVLARVRGWQLAGTFGGYDEPAVSLDPVDLPVGTSTFDFELPPLRGPASYHCEHFRLRWFVVAELRDGGGTGLDLTDLPIEVDRRRRDGDAEVVVAGYRDAPRRVASDFEAELGVRHQEGPREAHHTFGEWLGEALLSRHHVDVQLEAIPSRLEAGMPVDLKLWLYVKAPVDLEGIVLSLVRSEGRRLPLVAASSIVIADKQVSGKTHLEPGHTSYETRFVIPEDAVTSYADDSLFIEWVVRAVLVGGRPEMAREVVLTVV